MESKATDFMRILGLAACDSEAELKEAYWREIKIWHPDRHQDDPALQREATERAKKINAAFEHLFELLEAGRPLPRCSPGAESASTPRPQPGYHTQHTYKGKHFKPGFPDPNVFEVFLKSSCFISTGYDRVQRILYVKFTNGGIYAYRDVPESIFMDFLSAESHGKFANRQILHSFKWVAV